MAAGAGRVLVVEEHAHWTNGHFPVRCAQLASAYVDLGYQVELLTSEGWDRQVDAPPPRFAVRRFRPWTRWVRRAAVRTNMPFTSEFRTLLLAIEARAVARRTGIEPDLVVVLLWENDPIVLSVLAGRGRWLLNAFDGPRRTRSRRGRHTIATPIETRRQALGGRMRLAVASETMRDLWTDRVPFLDPTVLQIAGCRDLVAHGDPRANLDLPADRRLALFFGEPFLKQRDLVLDAFETLPEWTLVVGGRVGVALDPRERRVVLPGVVTDDVRDQLFLAVDLVVLAFSPHYPNNSGTLMDALSAGVPVVCPDDAAVAELVRHYRLGTLYRNGDASALAGAVRDAPTEIDPDDLARARRELSNRAVARRQLSAVGVDPPT
jgi:glycosyltransferase involved in cell wall biosynthesis